MFGRRATRKATEDNRRLGEDEKRQSHLNRVRPGQNHQTICDQLHIHAGSQLHKDMFAAILTFCAYGKPYTTSRNLTEARILRADGTMNPEFEQPFQAMVYDFLERRKGGVTFFPDVLPQIWKENCYWMQEDFDVTNQTEKKSKLRNDNKPRNDDELRLIWSNRQHKEEIRDGMCSMFECVKKHPSLYTLEDAKTTFEGAMHEYCYTCGGADSLKADNKIVFCTTCKIAYHQDCANIHPLPASAKPWFCRYCRGSHDDGIQVKNVHSRESPAIKSYRSSKQDTPDSNFRGRVRSRSDANITPSPPHRFKYQPTAMYAHGSRPNRSPQLPVMGFSESASSSTGSTELKREATVTPIVTGGSSQKTKQLNNQLFLPPNRLLTADIPHSEALLVSDDESFDTTIVQTDGGARGLLERSRDEFGNSRRPFDKPVGENIPNAIQSPYKPNIPAEYEATSSHTVTKNVKSIVGETGNFAGMSTPKIHNTQGRVSAASKQETSKLLPLEHGGNHNTTTCGGLEGMMTESQFSTSIAPTASMFSLHEISAASNATNLFRSSIRPNELEAAIPDLFFGNGQAIPKPGGLPTPDQIKQASESDRLGFIIKLRQYLDVVERLKGRSED